RLDARVERTGKQARIEPALEAVQEVADGVWYLDLSQPFDAALAAAMDEIVDGEGLIIDMREYPGGQWVSVLNMLSDKPLRTARLLMPRYILPDQVDATYQDRSWLLPGEARQVVSNVVFLTGPRAISQSETVMGVV